MVQNTSPDELKETIEQAQQKIEDAKQKEQGFMGRMYSKAKRFVTAPVDYVFGKEESYLKTAFYAAVGLAVVAAATYGGYQYGVNDPANVLVPGLSFMTRKDDPENLKSAFVGSLESLRDLQETINDMSPERKQEYLKWNSHILPRITNEINALEKALSVFMSKDEIEEIKNTIQSGGSVPHQAFKRNSPFDEPPKRRFLGLNPFYE